MKNKGFTLLESLIVLLIMSITTLFALPVWQQANSQLILQKEQQKLYLFLRQVQARVENSSEIWFLIPNRNINTQHWCITAQIKLDKLCDCFNPNICPKEAQAYFYYPYFPEKTMLVSKRYYPQEVTRLSGIRDTSSSTCFVLQAENSRTLFSFFNVGSLKLKDYQVASACVNDEA
ncbi:MAG: type II secretion system protein [Lonepinella koalarum]|nr:type II secretion system protein [Lonepinella koalarum]